jgi:hypothetical protein
MRLKDKNENEKGKKENMISASGGKGEGRYPWF